jgi:hypothetical protein
MPTSRSFNVLRRSPTAGGLAEDGVSDDGAGCVVGGAVVEGCADGLVTPSVYVAVGTWASAVSSPPPRVVTKTTVPTRRSSTSATAPIGTQTALEPLPVA